MDFSQFRLFLFLIKHFVCSLPTLSKLLDSGLEAFPYPPEESEDTTHPPIQITLRLPDSVIFWKEPVIARWDPAGTKLK